MPQAFDACRLMKGSKIKTKKLKGNKYMHICIRPDGSTVAGEVHEPAKTWDSNLGKKK